MNWDWPLLGRGADVQRLVRDLHDRDKHGVVIAGAPGIGKTRLARELIDRASKHGMNTVWVVGTHAAASMPFGAFARYLPPPERGDPDPVRLLQRFMRSFEERAVDRGLVVGVDNAHHLDAASATLVYELAGVDGLGVVVAVREGPDVPDPITELWVTGAAERVELLPLTRAQFDELVALTFQEPVSLGTVRQLWKLCQGNPLVFRELVRGALESGRLVLDAGVWRATDALARSSRMSELVATRIGALTPAERNGLEILAAGEPIGASVLRTLVDLSVLETLERRGLITEERSDRRSDLSVAHPIYATVIRQQTPSTQHRRIAAQLSQALAATGARRRDDVVRVATWMLDAGGTIEPDRMVEAARLALAAFDLDLAERFSVAAAEMCPFEGNLVHGETLFHQGKADRAERALAAAMAAAETEHQHARAALARAFNLALGARNCEAAVALLSTACDRSEDQRWCDELTAGLGVIYRLANKNAEAEQAVSELLERSNVSGRPLSRGLMIAATTATAGGRFDAALAYVERARPLWSRYPDRRLDEVVAEAFAVFALGLSGSLYAAERVGRAGLAAALASRTPTEGLYWALTLAEVLLVRGLAEDACHVIEAAVGDARIRDPLAILGPLLSMGAYAAAAGGDPGLAERSIKELETWPGRHAGGRGSALLMAQNGDMAGAAAMALETGREGVDSGNAAWAMLAFHDAVRYGFPQLVVDDLQQIAAAFDGALAATMAGHATALLAKDPAGLDDVSTAFEGMGAMLYAAEAAAQAATVFDKRHDPAAASRFAARAFRLFDECQGTPSPALMIRPRVLTAREDEIARMAASGMTSKRIAERLFISPRTVDNHLAAVYTKLGISNRRALATALGVVAS